MFDWQPVKQAIKDNKAIERIDSASENSTLNNDTLPSISLLENYAIISVKGEDALKFLQGQITCNILDLERKRFIRGAHCNPKGRMISNFTIARHSENHYMIKVHASNCQTAYLALKKYSVFFKLELFIDTDIACIAFHNTSELPDSHNIYQLPTIQNKITEFWSDKQTLINLLTEIQLPIIATQNYDKELILAGLADITHELTEKLLPQEINLQLIDGISFNKGCYTGQEIIARLHYKGQLKKHMYPVIINEEIPLKTIDTINNSQSKKVASIVNTVQCKNKTYALIMGELEELRKSHLYFNEKEITINEWLPHPYAIPK